MTWSTDDFRGPPSTPTPGRMQVAILLYPGFDLVDLVGAEHALQQTVGMHVHLVAAQHRPVASATVLAISPTITREDCPAVLDGLVVPGGEAVEVMRDPAWVRWIAARGAGARRLVALGHGSLLLGQAGLLRRRLVCGLGLNRDLLVGLGATPLNLPVVRDDGLVTTSATGAGAAFELAWADLLQDHPAQPEYKRRHRPGPHPWPAARPSDHPHPTLRGDLP